MPRPRPAVSKSSTLGLLPTVGVFLALGLTLWYVFQRPAVVAPGKVALGRLSLRRAQEAVVQNGIAGGATAGQAVLAELTAPKPDQVAVRVSPATAYCIGPVPDLEVATSDANHPPPAIRVWNVTSPGRYSTRAKAEEEAIREAKRRLEEVFQELHSPVRAEVDPETVRRTYLEPTSVVELPLNGDELTKLEASGLADQKYKVRLTVSVSEEQLRELRAQQRLRELSRWLAVALAVVAIAYGVLRAEDRSQGYFTGLWLAVGAVLIGGVVTLAVVL